MSKQIDAFLKEMEHEANTTRKMLSRIPDDKFDYKPHPKSMPISRLSAHIAEIPGWVDMALTTNELDFANPASYNRFEAHSQKELIPYFEKKLEEGKAALKKATDDQLDEKWTMRNGDKILAVNTVGETIRMAYCQIVHHRAQLGVFLRLLDVPIPGSYGPSADETGF
ncbi:MAG: DinB family protein [Chitinophagaceae bacterium]|nr:MAG: DinB family protein [Chitinophagaceae bacterium]